MRAWGAISLCVSIVACGAGLPLEERIDGVRPLAMRVEVIDPPPGVDEAVRAEGMPLERVRLLPLVTDGGPPWDATRLGEIEPVWLACVTQPIEGSYGCIARAAPIETSDLVDCPAPDLGAIDPAMPPAIPSPCRISGGSPAAAELAIPIDFGFLLGGDLEVTLVGHLPGEGSTDACLAAVLAGEAPAPSCLVVVQRVGVGPDAALVQLAADLGVPTDMLPPVPAETPDADRNPRITDVRAAFVAADAEVGTQVPLVMGQLVAVPLGFRAQLEVTAAADDLQTYVVRQDESDFAERQETYEGKWFVSWGELLGADSDDPLAQNEWKLERGEQDESDRPPGDVATLYYVLRDDRGGVDWFWFQVRVEPEPS
jgi:hypothetical protein